MPVICTIFFFNFLSSNFILINLIKVFINQFWFILILGLLFNWYRNYIIVPIVFLLYLTVFFKPLKFINIPLSNTLFFIHPNLLLISVCFCILKLINGKTTTNHLNLVLLMVSLTLGGYWALQELNWGGWWNWDSIEMYVLYITIMYLIYVHKFSKILNFNKLQINFNIFLLGNFFLYFLLNRLGVTISVHRFVKSNFLKYFTCWYIFLSYLIILYFIFSKKLTVCLILGFYIFLYTQFHSWYFLKKYALYFGIHFLFSKNIFFKKKLMYITHKFYYFIFLLIILFNFFNKSFFLKFYDSIGFISFFFFNKMFLIKFDYYIFYHICGIKKFFFYKVLNLKNFFFFNFFIKKSFLNMYFCLNFSKI